MELFVPADHKLKIKEREKINEYLDLAREQNNLWNMIMIMTPVVVGALGIIHKRLKKRQ